MSNKPLRGLPNVEVFVWLAKFIMILGGSLIAVEVQPHTAQRVHAKNVPIIIKICEGFANNKGFSFKLQEE